MLISIIKEISNSSLKNNVEVVVHYLINNCLIKSKALKKLLLKVYTEIAVGRKIGFGGHVGYLYDAGNSVGSPLEEYH